MINLSERLSEFSYGYGVTREVEKMLSDLGLKTAPYLPSLLDEKKGGYDVKFNGPGAAILLQFKLGHSLQRFFRADKSVPAPYLAKPFFRFSINTAEPDGQFESLLKGEADSSEVYYVAPRFADWPHYANAFENGTILDQSVMIKPSEIRSALDSKSEPDGNHRIVYDSNRVYVCSKPTILKEVRATDIASITLKKVREDKNDLSEIVRRIYAGLNDRSSIRREPPENHADQEKDTAPVVEGVFRREIFSWRVPLSTMREARARRFVEFEKRTRTRDHAYATAVGFEFWTLGSQLLLVGEKD